MADRQEWFASQRSDKHGVVPAGALARARDQERALESKGLLPRTSGRAASTGAADQGEWEQIGPAPMSRGGRMDTGRVTAVALVDDDTWYAAGALGGVWRTDDAGASWSPLSDDQPSLAVSSLALDPAAPATLWAGTGEANCNSDAYYGAGILRTVDGGLAWTQHGAALFERGTVARVALDPSSPAGKRVLYAAVAVCSPPSRHLGIARTAGLAKSVDGGDTWAFLTDLTGVFSLGTSSTDVIVVDQGTVYAAVGYDPDSTRNGVYRSRDGGVTFAPLRVGLPQSRVGRIALASAPSDRNVLYAVIADAAGSELLGVYRSADGGDTWRDISRENRDWGGQWRYNMTIAVDPSDSDTVYVGGIDLHKTVSAEAHDPDWAKVTQHALEAGSVHGDQHAIAISKSLVVIGNDGGVFVSRDSGTTWQSANGSPPRALAIVQGYRGAPHPTDPDVFYMGTQDNGTVRRLGDVVWEQVASGDGGFTEVDYENPAIVYEVYPGLRISRSYDGGLTWTPATTGIADGDRRGFVAPLVMNPSRPSTLYAGTSRVYRTTDRGASWTAISSHFSQTVLTAIAVGRDGGLTIYTGDAGGRIWVTKDGGVSWSESAAMSSAIPTGRHLTDLAVDPRSPGTAYAAYSGFDAFTPNVPGHLFKTEDAGATWRNVSALLPDVPTNSVAVHPVDPDTVFVGTDIGVYMSRDGGLGWASLNEGLPRVGVAHAVVNRAGTHLFAVTHGRSVYRRELGAMTPSEPGKPATTFFFAEGTVRPGFVEYLTLQNPGPLSTIATVAYQVADDGGTRIEVAPLVVELAPRSRVTRDVGADLADRGLRVPADVSIEVVSDGPLVAERPLYFRSDLGGRIPGGVDGGTSVIGAKAPSTRHLFAEGTIRPGFVEYLTLQNHGNDPTTARVEFRAADDRGAAVVVPPVTLALGARSRSTVDVTAHIESQWRARSLDVSVEVVSDRPIVVERPLYFRSDFAGLFPAPVNGGTAVIGAGEPALSHYFAEGTVRPGFLEFVTILNPTSLPAHVTLSLQASDDAGSPVFIAPLERAVGPGARATLPVHEHIWHQGVTRAVDVSLVGSSDQPVVMERALYFDTALVGGADGGTAVIGARAPAYTHQFAEGTARSGFTEYITILNPSEGPAHVTLEFQAIDDSGRAVDLQSAIVEVRERSRATVSIDAHLASLGVALPLDVSLVALSDRPIVVERPLYFRADLAGKAGGIVDGGTVSFGLT